MSPATWYAARAGGLVAFSLLTLTVVVGLLLSGRLESRRWPRFALEDLHRFAGVLTGVFVAVHGASILLDSYVSFSVADVLVPGHAQTRPVATGLGIVAAELLAAVALTNRYRRRLPYRIWRRVHYALFAVWWLALVHGLTGGTDATAPWALALFVAGGAAVVGLTARRVLAARPVPSWAVALWPAVAAVLTAELVVTTALVRAG